jgi:hypothetical protein
MPALWPGAIVGIMQSIFPPGFFRPRRLLDRCLSPRGLAALSIVGAAAVVFGERDFATIPFVLAVFCAIWMALRQECKGAFFLCSDHARIERHLKRLAKGHLLDLAPGASQKDASAAAGPQTAERDLSPEHNRRAAALGK